MQDLAIQREHMIEVDLEARGIKDPVVLAAMRRVRREEFIPVSLRAEAYADHPLPIGKGQTISQPYIVARMTELAAAGPESVVLEVGTGSGYQTAVLAEICREVYSVEIVSSLAEKAQRNLEALGYPNTHVRFGDGARGWPEHAPYDAVVVTAAPEQVPPGLLAQVRPGGRMVIPIGTVQTRQHLVLIRKDEDGTVTQERILPVRFVPLTGPEMDRENPLDHEEQT